MSAEEHSTKGYVKIYVILLVLFGLSLLGTESPNRTVMLLAAFGIAIVKALMVARSFMHLHIEKKIIWYMFFGMLLMVALFFIGVAPDVMKSSGQHWENEAAQTIIKERATNDTSSSHHE